VRQTCPRWTSLGLGLDAVSTVCHDLRHQVQVVSTWQPKQRIRNVDNCCDALHGSCVSSPVLVCVPLGKKGLVVVCGCGQAGVHFDSAGHDLTLRRQCWHLTISATGTLQGAQICLLCYVLGNKLLWVCCCSVL